MLRPAAAGVNGPKSCVGRTPQRCSWVPRATRRTPSTPGAWAHSPTLNRASDREGQWTPVIRSSCAGGGLTPPDTSSDYSGLTGSCTHPSC